MPPIKEPKAPVHYPASKRPAPPYKPMRPTKVPRIATTESESSVKSKPAAKKPAPKATEKKAAKSIAISDSEDEEAGARRDGSEKDEDSDKDRTLALQPKKRTTNAFKPASKIVQRKAAQREASPLSVSSLGDGNGSPAATTGSPLPSRSDSSPSIPQPLLLRLLHETFENKDTRIDKHAIQVVQKYVEVFVRETIARAAQLKKEAAEKGEVDSMEAGWLELADLEKVAPGMLLDF